MEQPPEQAIDIERDGENVVTVVTRDRFTGRTSLRNTRVLLSILSAMGQIIASIVILVFSSDERQPGLLVAWVKAYTVGCALRLPFILSTSYHTLEPFWIEKFPFELLHLVISLCEPGQHLPNQSTNERLTRCYKIVLNIYFVALFVTSIPLHGDICESRELYRLFIAFSLYTFIWYGTILLELIILLLFMMLWPCLYCYWYCNTSLLRVASPNGNQNLSRQTNQISQTRDEGIVAAETQNERCILGDDAVCCICLALYVNDDELKELPCHHLFHSFCIDKWLKINASCPLCKYKLQVRSFRLPLAGIASNRT